MSRRILLFSLVEGKLSIRRGSLCNKMIHLAPISVTTEIELSEPEGVVYGVWARLVCYLGFSNSGMIYEEEKKMLLAKHPVVKNEEC